jgi:hypothetical protein
MSSSHHICDQKVGKMINKTQWNWRNKMEREERKGGRKRKKMVTGGSKAHGFFFLVERTKRQRRIKRAKDLQPNSTNCSSPQCSQ